MTPPERRADPDLRALLKAMAREMAKETPKNGGWKTALLGISGAILSIILVAAISLGASAYREIDRTKLDKETFQEFKENILTGLQRIERGQNRIREWLGEKGAGNSP